MSASRVLVTASFLALAACDTAEIQVPTPPADAGFYPDAAAPRDAGPPPADAGPDAGFVRPDAGTPTPDAGFGPQPCSPALTIGPQRATVLPLGLLTFVAAGGTGDYRYTLVDDQSGAVVNDRSGAYLSGTRAGVQDVVVVHDEGCVGTATATARVVEPMEVRPSRAEIAPGATLQIEVLRGSGQHGFALASGTAGGAIDMTGRYTAGTTEGTDVVRVRDTETGEEVDALIDVVRGASLRPDPPVLLLPERASMRLAVGGGSGFFDVSSSAPDVAAPSGLVVTGSTAGSAVLTVRDRFTGQTVTVPVSTLGAQVTTATRAGDYQFAGAVVTPGDLDGDGYPEAIVGWGEADVDAVDSGAVYVYRGTGSGLDPRPAQIISGVGRFSNAGRSVVVTDVTRDGQPDLVVGAMRADVGNRDNGGVYIYRGVANGLFESTPFRVLGGINAFDYYGFAVEVCDFNADGWADLAVGAWLAEDLNRRTRATNQGAVHVHLGGMEGFSDQPEFTVYGDVPDGSGGWEGSPDMRLGNALAVGDFDGDGACDLAAGAYNYRAAPGGSADGAVLVFKGVAAGANGRGGITQRPVRGWVSDVATDRGAQLGRFLTAGDLDGDGRAELAISHHLANIDGVPGNDNGAVRIFSGGPMPDAPITALASATSADLTWAGDSNADQGGWSMQIVDVDGDMRNDLVVNGFLDEPAGGPGDVGTLTIYAGRTGMFPDLTMPVRQIAGFTAGDRLGTFFSVSPDMDGDGTKDIVTMLSLDDAYGRDVGAPWFIPAEGRTPMRLELPALPAGDQIGRGSDVVGDVNGDGFNDVVVGGYLSDDFRRGVNAGTAWLYLGSANGISRTPALEIAGFFGHSGGDGFGWKVSRAGDFDGDGIDDFAVLARNEDRPGAFGNQYAPERACAGALNNSGAVYVFRGARGALPSTTPMFVWYGPQANDFVWDVAGGFDMNGDGFDDLVITGTEWDAPGAANSGGFAVIQGRAAPANGRIGVICDAALTWLGLNANDQIGRGASRLGDLNGDGCDELAVGGDLEDFGNTNQGTVRVVFGFGPTCSSSIARALTLRSDMRNAQAGYSVAGGLDVDGDNVPDLAVGGVGMRLGTDTTGGAWLIQGSYLAGLTPEPLTAQPPAQTWAFAPPSGTLNLIVGGTTSGERAGSGVGLVPFLGGQGRAAVAIGGPSADFAGTALAGGLRVYRFEPTVGMSTQPIAAFAGETDRPDGLLGDAVAAGGLGPRGIVVVGGYQSSGAGLDTGAAYVLELRP